MGCGTGMLTGPVRRKIAKFSGPCRAMPTLDGPEKNFPGRRKIGRGGEKLAGARRKKKLAGAGQKKIGRDGDKIGRGGEKLAGTGQKKFPGAEKNWRAGAEKN